MHFWSTTLSCISIIFYHLWNLIHADDLIVRPTDYIVDVLLPLDWCQKSADHLITAHQSYAFSTIWKLSSVSILQKNE